MRSTCTENCVSHFKPESLIPSKVSMHSLVKAPQQKKNKKKKQHRDAALSATFSFKSEDEVKIIVEI